MFVADIGQYWVHNEPKENNLSPSPLPKKWAKIQTTRNSKSVRINKLCTDFISNLLKIRKYSIS